MTRPTNRDPSRALSAAWSLPAGVLVVTLALAIADSVPRPVSADETGWMERFWSPYQELLDRHLEEHITAQGGLVSAFDYRAALDDERTAPLLSRQNRLLAEFDQDRLDTREAALSFWLNAYNYFMLEHILENPRGGELVGSVRDYGNLLNPYRVFRREIFDVGGRRYSLSGIENDILLGEGFAAKGWKEARVRFAVNCASVGCPPLRSQVYLPGNVDELLTENTRRAFNTERHLHLDGATLYLSRLFDWYAEHFVAEQGSIEGFVRAYADEGVREKVARAERIRFIDYDWTLNSPEHFPELAGG